MNMSEHPKRLRASGTAGSQREEAVRLHEWCCFVLETMARLHPELTSLTGWKDGFDVALREGWVSALRTSVKDLLEWIHGLKAADCARIDEALRSRFGAGLAENTRAMGGKVRAIIKRGNIEDDDECRLIQSWLEMIAGNPKKRSEMKAINELVERSLTGRV